MRNDLPAGTVTFLFSDVEGSTRLLNKLGADAYAQELSEHRRVARAAFARHGGIEVDTQGDAFFVAFPAAPEAVAAAREAQRELDETRIRLRIGVHTGTPLVTGEGYVGPDVHRAARIAAAGHGGQILISAATAGLLGEVKLLDLGLHRLKDLSAPEHIYQLGDGDFPPLRTLYRTNLPVPLTPFLGRTDEVAAVVGLASRPDVRLLTLTGAGGTGKTRLAQQTAAELGDRYAGGVWWVPLASLRDPQLVLETAGRVVGSKNGLAEHIGATAMLLVFDNFEQVIDAGADVAEVLGACPNLRVLVTSREILHVAGEHVYAVPSLTSSDAHELFVARATAADSTFADDGAVVEICRRLDELPLAVELAAARVTSLPPRQILARLDRRLPLLTSGARDLPERQRTLRAAIEWSHELLSDDERTLFARMSVFRGGCTLEAAEAVADADLDLLQSLIDKSLLRRRDDRYVMLETLREYATERLEAAGEADGLRLRHAEFFVEFARTAEKFLQVDDSGWVDRVAGDHDNFRAALDHFETRARWQAVFELAGAIHRFWYVRGHLREGRRRLEVALSADRHPTLARAMALRAASVMTLSLGDHVAALRHAEESLGLYREHRNLWGEAYALVVLGNAAAAANEMPNALLYFEESVRLFERLGDQHFAMIARSNLGWSVGSLGDRKRERALKEQVLAEARAAGYERVVAWTLGDLASIDREDGLLDHAAALQREAIVIDHRLGDVQHLAVGLEGLAATLTLTGQGETAARLLGYTDAVFEALGSTREPWNRERYDQTVELLRGALDQDDINDAMASGRTMTEDEIVELASQPRSDSATKSRLRGPT